MALRHNLVYTFAAVLLLVGCRSTQVSKQVGELTPVKSGEVISFSAGLYGPFSFPTIAVNNDSGITETCAQGWRNIAAIDIRPFGNMVTPTGLFYLRDPMKLAAMAVSSQQGSECGRVRRRYGQVISARAEVLRWCETAVRVSQGTDGEPTGGPSLEDVPLTTSTLALQSCLRGIVRYRLAVADALHRDVSPSSITDPATLVHLVFAQADNEEGAANTGAFLERLLEISPGDHATLMNLTRWRYGEWAQVKNKLGAEESVLATALQRALQSIPEGHYRYQELLGYYYTHRLTTRKQLDDTKALEKLTDLDLEANPQGAYFLSWLRMVQGRRVEGERLLHTVASQTLGKPFVAEARSALQALAEGKTPEESFVGPSSVVHANLVVSSAEADQYLSAARYEYIDLVSLSFWNNGIGTADKNPSRALSGQ